MNPFRRFTALLLAFVLVTGLVPVRALAEEQEPLTFETTYINPLYADIISEEDIPAVVTPKVQTYEAVNYVTTVEEAGIILREQIKARAEAATAYIFADVSTQEEFDRLCADLLDVIIEHTGVPNEGDYIRWHLSAYSASATLYSGDGGNYIDLTFAIDYHSDAAQEAAVDTAVEDLLDRLNLSGKTDFEKVKAVYDYICENVRYDHYSSGTLKHTAYAALINNSAVCQGYASLLYRLLLELDVDTRLIAGIGNGGPHGWNIVELDNLYYNADSTWDEGTTSYSWFLKSPDNFPEHERYEEYDTSEFHHAYPMSAADYPYTVHTHSYRTVVTAPTCTEKGYTTYICSCGYTFTGKEVAELGHQWDDGVVTKEPTESSAGVKLYTCTVCKVTRTEEFFIPVSCDVERISGKDRVKTALSVAKALKDTLKVDKFDAVIIATGVNEKFADALSGSYLANRKKAPILLYTNSGLSQLNVNFIKENLRPNGTVYILGGTGAIPESVEKTLTGYNVRRLSGKTRYETNLVILKEAGVSGADEILVATGTNFADSLSASAVGLPLMLVNGKGSSLNAAQIEFLKSVSGKKITIIGGTGAVNEEMEAAVEVVTGVTTERISGKTRHNTSVMIAQKYFKNPECAMLTYAKNFPDGLAGGPLAYAMGAPLLLISDGQESIANKYLTTEGIDKGYVLGGDSAVSDGTARKAFGLPAGAVIERAYYTE